MKKTKLRVGKQPGELESLRAGSAYHGARGFLGVPFLIFGALFCAGALLTVLVALYAGAGSDARPLATGAGMVLSLLGAAIQLICGLFCFGISALAGALFDVADCALLAESRGQARAAQEAYEAYRMKSCTDL